MEKYVVITEGKAKKATLNALKTLSPTLDSKIVIKPNLVYDEKNNGVTTNVEVVEGIIEHFKNSNDIIIAEGSCECDTLELFNKFGYSKLVDKYDIKLIDLNKDSFQKFKLYDKDIEIAKSVLGVNLISVPVLKTHEYTTMSACIKNLMGCLKQKKRCDVTYDSTKESIHIELSALQDAREDELNSKERVFFPKERLPEYWSALEKFEHRLVALYRTIQPKLGVIDSIVASEGNAPISGSPVNRNLIFASENPVNCDAVAAYTMGINPTTIGYLQVAKEQKLGEINTDHIKTNVDLQQHVRKFKLPPFVDYLYKNIKRQIMR